MAKIFFDNTKQRVFNSREDTIKSSNLCGKCICKISNEKVAVLSAIFYIPLFLLCNYLSKIVFQLILHNHCFLVYFLPLLFSSIDKLLLSTSSDYFCTFDAHGCNFCPMVKFHIHFECFTHFEDF